MWLAATPWMLVKAPATTSQAGPVPFGVQSVKQLTVPFAPFGAVSASSGPAIQSGHCAIAGTAGRMSANRRPSRRKRAIMAILLEFVSGGRVRRPLHGVAPLPGETAHAGRGPWLRGFRH